MKANKISNPFHKLFDDPTPCRITACVYSIRTTCVRPLLIDMPASASIVGHCKCCAGAMCCRSRVEVDIDSGGMVQCRL